MKRKDESDNARCECLTYTCLTCVKFSFLVIEIEGFMNFSYQTLSLDLLTT